MGFFAPKFSAMHPLFAFALVFLGGGFGSICRYTLWLWLQPILPRFPFATLAANAAACLVLGLLTGLQLKNELAAQHRLLLATGFCGGFSTFSTFTAETWQLAQNGQAATALGNVLLNLAACFACFFLGLKLAQ